MKVTRTARHPEQQRVPQLFHARAEGSRRARPQSRVSRHAGLSPLLLGVEPGQESVAVGLEVSWLPLTFP
jgi:hypothetical protein